MLNKQLILKSFVLALIIKGIIFIVFSISFHNNWKKPSNYLFVSSKDYGSYIVPSENLINHGMLYEASRSRGKLFSYKMPGMAPIYAPLYAFFGREIALNILIVFQFFADVISVALLSLIAAQLLKSTKMFWITFCIYAFSTSVSLYTHFALSELFCTFFIIVSVFYFLKALTTERWIFYCTSGFFITWALFFRPTCGVFLAIYPLIILLSKVKSTSFNTIVKKSMLFLLPFILLESTWIIRNYHVSDEFVPLESSREDFGTPQTIAIFKMIQAWGGDIQSWNSRSEAKWFFKQKYTEHVSIEELQKFSFPSHLLFKPEFIETFNQLKKNYTLPGKTLSRSQRDSISNSIVNTINIFIKNYKSEYPFRYYVVAPIKLMIQLVFPSDTYNLPFVTNSFLHKSLRIISLLSYYLVIISAIMGIFICLIYETNVVFKCISLFPVLHVLAIGAIMRMPESRYMVPVFPILTIYAAYFFYATGEKYFSSKRAIISQ